MLHLASNTAAFIFALGVIIFVHEAGHLLVAKAFGMKVLAFSLGFGKRPFGWKVGETDYRISLVPLGGYVKLSGEEPGESTDDPRDFLNQPRWQRILVYLAGPLMNGALSILLIAGLFMVGIEVPALQSVPSVIGTVEAASPGAAAGLLPGDEIVAIDGKEVSRWQDVAFTILTGIGKPLEFEIDRNGARSKVSVTPVKPADFENEQHSTATSRAWVLGSAFGPRTSRKATFSQTRSESNSAPPWNSIPKRARKASRSPFVTSCPSSVIVPASGRTSPRMPFKSTDFPVPDPPMITIEVPEAIDRFTPCNTRLSPNRF